MKLKNKWHVLRQLNVKPKKIDIANVRFLMNPSWNILIDVILI